MNKFQKYTDKLNHVWRKSSVPIYLRIPSSERFNMAYKHFVLKHYFLKLKINKENRWLTAERLRWGPSDRMTSSVRSDWSESQTKPMVTISGEFMRTRLILIFCPQLLWKIKTKKKITVVTKGKYTPKPLSKNYYQNCYTSKETLLKHTMGKSCLKASTGHWTIWYTLLFHEREQCAY